MTKIVVGADEAGRGLIIGPMTIGACAIDDKIESIFWEVGIKDSKKYTTIKKIDAHVNVIKKQALAFSVITLQSDILNRLLFDQNNIQANYNILNHCMELVSQIYPFTT